MVGWQPWVLHDRAALAQYVTADAGRLFPQPFSSMGRSTPEGRRDLVRAIYEVVCGVGIYFDIEPSTIDGRQVIRSPDEVLQTRRADCLDLAVLFSGLCLANHLLPLLIVLDGHALAAVSLYNNLDPLRFTRPERHSFTDGVIVDISVLLSLIHAGGYLAVDCVGAARTISTNTASFEGAVAVGRGLLAADPQPVGPGRGVSARFLFALDVVSVHDLGYTPFQLPGVVQPSLAPNALPHTTAIENFVTDHLGAKSDPVPFGGRAPELAALDRWLDEPGPPLLILTAGAGVGKSTLLVHWLNRLRTGEGGTGREVVFVPISIRYELSAEAAVLDALIARLARVHQEELPTTRDLGPIHLRALLAEYLRRAPPGDNTLLIIIDGLDEAVGWEVGPSLLPHRLPEKIRIVVSARNTLARAGPTQWCQHLGLADSQVARVALTPLDEDGVHEALASAGTLIERVDSLSEVAGELHRLSQGDPLVLGLYLRDLRAQDAVSAADLQRLTPGFRAFFDRWWNEQKHQWLSLTGTDTYSLLYVVLSLLASALGPLERRDLRELASEGTSIDAERLDGALEALQRFVSAGPTPFSLVFSHPRFGDYWRDRLLATGERDAYLSRLLRWCRRTAAELRQGRRHPASVPAYVVRHYADHLETSAASAEEFRDLADPSWAAAWEASADELSGHLSDVQRALGVTIDSNGREVAAGRQASLLALQVGYMAVLADASSRFAMLSPELAAELVAHGVWSELRALNYLAGIRSSYHRAFAIGVVVPRLRSSSSAAVQALYASLSDQPPTFLKANALAGCVVFLASTGRWREALAAAKRAAQDDREPTINTQALLDSLPHLPQAGQVEALGLLLATAESAHEWSRRGLLNDLTGGVDRETAASIFAAAGDQAAAKDPSTVILSLLTSENRGAPFGAALKPGHLMCAARWMPAARLERELTAVLAALPSDVRPDLGIPFVESLLSVVPDKLVPDLVALAEGRKWQDAAVMVDVVRRPWAVPGLDSERFIIELGRKAVKCGPETAAKFVQKLAEIGRGEAALRLIEAWNDDPGKLLAAVAPALNEAQVSRALGMVATLATSRRSRPKSALLARQATFGPEQAAGALAQVRAAVPGEETMTATAILRCASRGEPAVSVLLEIGDENCRLAALAVASSFGVMDLDAFDAAVRSFHSVRGWCAFDWMLPSLADRDLLAPPVRRLLKEFAADDLYRDMPAWTAIRYLRRVSRADGPGAALAMGRDLVQYGWEDAFACALMAAAPDQDWAEPGDVIRAFDDLANGLIRATGLVAAVIAFPGWRDELVAAISQAVRAQEAMLPLSRMELLFQALAQANLCSLARTLLPVGICDHQSGYGDDPVWARVMAISREWGVSDESMWPDIVTCSCRVMDRDQVHQAQEMAWHASDQDCHRVRAVLAIRLADLGYLDEALSAVDAIPHSKSVDIATGLAGILPSVRADRLPDWLARVHGTLGDSESRADRAWVWANLACRWTDFDRWTQWQALRAWAERLEYQDRADLLVDLLGYIPVLRALGAAATADGIIASLALDTPGRFPPDPSP